ncbi:phosphate acetyltransferase [Vibrio sp. SCSIO 43132]|uniref:phosphate acetyltransferase n=1 Tax=Vibrio sp. SCSIO 43132 TaxID=2779363 RepID=UPI001CA7EA69|nr:phosphate acetyltransferase [Vibrio sp. SCSIO 43132]UAB73427.1 phosphate acetyltransferase [Vibrio sp. SCSIO 43132]
MKAIERIILSAKENPKTIALCEGQDPRVIKAALRAQKENIAKVILVGSNRDLETQAKAQGLDLHELTLVETHNSEWKPDLAQAMYEARKHKGMTQEDATRLIEQPLVFANMLVRQGYADGLVAGAVHTTAEVVRHAIQLIGTNRDFPLVSSFFIMMLCEPFHQHKGSLIFTDCGLVVDPNEEQLANIAITASKSATQLLNVEPRIAMLSFSTNGSAQHSAVDKVINAAKLVKNKHPDLTIDEDVQFDAAIVKEIASKKSPNSAVQGDANILVFPNLEAGNIGYKLAERLSGAKAIGPLLQGLAKPANDLSRGCSEDDIFHVIATTVVQAQHT